MAEPSFSVRVIHSGTLAPVVRYLESLAVPEVAAKIRHAYVTDNALALALTPDEAAAVDQVEMRETAGGK